MELGPKQSQGTDPTDPSGVHSLAQLSRPGVNTGEQRQAPNAQWKICLGSSCVPSNSGSGAGPAVLVLRAARSASLAVSLPTVHI